jgi:hypothetical protein
MEVRDIVVNWSGKGKGARRYFSKAEKRFDGFDFEKVKPEKADVLIEGTGREAAREALIQWFVDDGCCKQYAPSQQDNWLSAAEGLGILLLPPGGAKDLPGAPK